MVVNPLPEGIGNACTSLVERVQMGVKRGIYSTNTTIAVSPLILADSTGRMVTYPCPETAFAVGATIRPCKGEIGFNKGVYTNKPVSGILAAIGAFGQQVYAVN